MRRFVATVALLVVLAAPAAAQAGWLGRSVSVPLVDAAAGRVVWQPDAGSIRVRDLGDGVAAHVVVLPEGCVPAGRGALRGDRLILACADGSRLLDLVTGAAGPVPGWDAARAGAGESGVLVAGSVWAEGWTGAGTVYFELAGARQERGFGTADQLPDLDAPELWRPLCAPLTRTADPDPVGAEAAWLPYAYSPPLGLGHRPFEYRPLRVDRCGRERSVRLSRCADACAAVSLGAGSIAWRERGRIRLYRGASRRRASWGADRFGPAAAPVPTLRHVVVTAGGYGAYVVWAVRAPI